MANQGGSHEQHVKAGQQSHKGSSSAKEPLLPRLQLKRMLEPRIRSRRHPLANKAAPTSSM